MKTVHTATGNGVKVKVVFNADYDEYRCEVYQVINGIAIHKSQRDCFTDDKQDAIDTANWMVMIGDKIMDKAKVKKFHIPFKEVKVKEPFALNGNLYVKWGTKTGRLLRADRIFYIGKDELCVVVRYSQQVDK